MADASTRLERSNGECTYTHLEYNNEHDVIAYTVIKNTQCECGQVFKLKRGLQHFQKSQVSTSKAPG